MSEAEEQRALLSVNDDEAKRDVEDLQKKKPQTPLQKLSETLSSLGDRTQKAGVFGTSASVLKLIVGAGSFVLPSVTSQIGIGGLLLAATVLPLLCLYCSWIAIAMKQELMPLQDVSMAQFARATFPKRLRFNTVIAATLEFCIFGTSVLGCAVYLNFTGGVLSTVYCPIPPYQYVLIMSGVVLLAIVLQSVLVVFKRWDPLLFLSRSSLIGFLAAVGAAVATCVLGAIQNGGIATHGPYVWLTADSAKNLPDSFGSIAFLFCIGLFMFPLHSSIDRPRNFNKSLVAGFSIAWIFNLAIGSLGYTIFGAAVSGIVVNSLVPGLASSRAVQVVLSTDIFFTFLIVVVPSSNSIRVLLGLMSRSLVFDPDDWSDRSARRMFIGMLAPLIVLVLVTALAIFVPGVGALQGLVAAIGLSFTGICFPAICQLLLRKNGFFSVVWHWFIIIFGAVAGGYTLYLSVSSLIATYSAAGSAGLFSTPNCTAIA